MKHCSSYRIGAGITQLAECQLPKLNVAGSIPVTRSIILMFTVILFFTTVTTASANEQPDFWLEASGCNLQNNRAIYASMSEQELTRQLKNGNIKSLIPILSLLVQSGRMEDAEIWMETRGKTAPVTRRDLAIALSWYGRFDLYGIMSVDFAIPPDIENDDLASTISAILYVGWMNTSTDGYFHPGYFIGLSELEYVSKDFFPSSFHWEKDWIGIESLDSLFAAGARERTPENG